MAQKTTQRTLLFLLPVAVGAVIFTLVVSGKEPPAARPLQEHAYNVRIIITPVVDFVPRATGYGFVEPELVWDAVAEVEGRIVAMHPELRRGAIIPKGELLMRIDPAQRLTATAQSEADVSLLLASLEELDQTEANLQRQLAVEQETLNISLKELERRQRLVAQGVISESEVDLERQNYLRQKKAVQEIENQLALIPAQRQELQAQLTQSRSRLEDATLNVNKTEIRAPFDGRLRSESVELGQAVAPGQVLAQLDSMGVAEALAEIPLHVMRRVIPRGVQSFTKGMTMEDLRKLFSLQAIVRLTVGEEEVEWTGRLARIREEVDPQARTIGVYVAVDDPYMLAVPGVRPPLLRNLYCEVELRGKPLLQAVVVPRNAVRQGKVLLVDGENRLRRVDLTLDITQGDVVVIEKGLSGGERLVVSDLPYAVDGMLLAPEHDAALEARLVMEAEASGAVQ